MLRIVAVVSALGLLALGIMVSLNTGGEGLAGLFRTDGEPMTDSPMVESGTGKPITLETVQREVDWRRETAQKLRDLK